MSAELWRPTSGCGPACLPARAPAVPVARRLARLAGVLGMLLAGAGLAAPLALLPAAERAAVVRAWARGTARALGVRLEVHGRPPRRRALLVANHVSWLDVLAILAVAPARLLAKREVRAWPLVGLLARAGGAFFVDRSRPRDLPVTVARLAGALRAGHPVAVFPEGTTWCGTAAPAACRPGRGFRPAVFQAAIDAGAPVVPLRLEYRSAVTGEVTTAAAFLGEENLWQSVRRVLAGRDLVLAVRVTAALHPARDADRRLLARAAEAAVHLVPARPVPPPAVRARPHAAPVPPRAVPAPPPAGPAGAVAVRPAFGAPSSVTSGVPGAGETDLAA
ncbi:lysophospholipid acyltransferase family protein [Micromonospora sp. CPCC 205556]|uniref:lysophospholipid acyltransferase family protein n=1 Tax=Micromonospora sp. CPCC 205556 TaxID=3122398 RepID=UPI002FF1AED3